MPSNKRYQRHYSSQHTGERNPMFTKRNWQSYVIDNFSLASWLSLLGLVGVLYLLFFTPWFTVQTVQIEGTDARTAHSIHDEIVRQQLGHQRLLIIPQSNLLALDTEEIHKAITQRYTFAELTVRKDFPHSIQIVLAEQAPSLVWYSGGNYYFLSDQGVLTSTITDIETEGSAYAHVIDTSDETVSVGQSVISAETTAYIKQLDEYLAREENLPVFNYSMPNNLATRLSVHITDAPYVIYFDISRPLDQQITKLQRVINEGLIAEKNPREYIDLRIGDRVYFK